MQAANLLKATLLTAPEELRRRLRALPTGELVAVVARLCFAGEPEDVEAATRFALRPVARRYQALSEEISELDAQLERLVAQATPGARLLAGSRHEPRRHTARPGRRQPREAQERGILRQPLCGVSPVEASSGKVVRHRLNLM